MDDFLYLPTLQIWKERRKDLWILFTNWGRVGASDPGQYQNTPFAAAAAAEEEFRKIFRSKSGNDWEDRDDFVEQRKKYRLVKVEHLRRVTKEEVEFDLETDAAPSRLPACTQLYTYSQTRL